VPTEPRIPSVDEQGLLQLTSTVRAQRGHVSVNHITEQIALRSTLAFGPSSRALFVAAAHTSAALAKESQRLKKPPYCRAVVRIT
jgi:hypothetical protein